MSDLYEATQTEKKFVSRLIKEQRFALGFTPNQAAEAAGISRQSWYRWEAGRIGSPVVKIVCWLLDFDGTSKVSSVGYWRKRALIAEKRLEEIQRTIDEYNQTRSAMEQSHDGFLPKSVTSIKHRRTA